MPVRQRRRLGGFGGWEELMVRVVVKGVFMWLGWEWWVLWVWPRPLRVVAEMGPLPYLLSSSLLSGWPQGAFAAAVEGRLRTGAMDPAGVEGGVGLPEDSAVTRTSVVTVP